MLYLPADPAVPTAKVAFEVPLTVEVYDREIGPMAFVLDAPAIVSAAARARGQTPQ